MENVKMIGYGLACGIRDALRGTVVVFTLDRNPEQPYFKRIDSQSSSPERDDSGKRSVDTVLARRRAALAQKKGLSQPDHEKPKVMHRILQCCALNGGVFLASILMFDSILLPFLKQLIHLVFGGTPELSQTVWYWMKPVLLYTFGALWVLPLFLLSRVVNSLWFQDIAEVAYRRRRGRPFLLPSFSKLIADTLFSVLIQAMFLVQGMLVSLLPIMIVGQLTSLIHMCLLYSLYAFEYQWLNMGWELHRRLSYLEKNWPYFIGFGLPLAVLTAIPSSYLVSGCVFSILFPLFIVSGTEADPVTGTCDYPLQLFSPVVCLSNFMFDRTMGPPPNKMHVAPMPVTPVRSNAPIQKPGLVFREPSYSTPQQRTRSLRSPNLSSSSSKRFQ